MRKKFQALVKAIFVLLHNYKKIMLVLPNSTKLGLQTSVGLQTDKLEPQIIIMPSK